MTQLRAGFIGLGAMGWHMAAHLKRAGMLEAVSNRTPAKAQAFAQEHGVTAGSPGQLAAQCNVIALCVSADKDVLDVVREIAANAKPGMIVIDHSTVSSRTAQQGCTSTAGRGPPQAPVRVTYPLVVTLSANFDHPSSSSVRGSGSLPKYRSSTAVKTGSRGAARAKSVMDDRSLRSSG